MFKIVCKLCFKGTESQEKQSIQFLDTKHVSEEMSSTENDPNDGCTLKDNGYCNQSMAITPEPSTSSPKRKQNESESDGSCDSFDLRLSCFQTSSRSQSIFDIAENDQTTQPSKSTQESYDEITKLVSIYELGFVECFYRNNSKGL